MSIVLSDTKNGGRRRRGGPLVPLIEMCDTMPYAALSRTPEPLRWPMQHAMNDGLTKWLQRGIGGCQEGGSEVTRQVVKAARMASGGHAYRTNACVILTDDDSLPEWHSRVGLIPQMDHNVLQSLVLHSKPAPSQFCR
jgi:hypothetical protein